MDEREKCKVIKLDRSYRHHVVVMGFKIPESSFVMPILDCSGIKFDLRGKNCMQVLEFLKSLQKL
jgi:hypothetical protein